MQRRERDWCWCVTMCLSSLLTGYIWLLTVAVLMVWTWIQRAKYSVKSLGQFIGAKTRSLSQSFYQALRSAHPACIGFLDLTVSRRTEARIVLLKTSSFEVTRCLYPWHLRQSISRGDFMCTSLLIPFLLVFLLFLPLSAFFSFFNKLQTDSPVREGKSSRTVIWSHESVIAI